MKNILKLIVRDDNRVETEFLTSDGVTTWQLHNEKLNDEQVLIKFSRNKHYSHFKGEWELHIDSKTFIDSTFTGATSQVIAYINERDNPNTYMINFF